jgi:hypothetical protein
MNTNRIRGVNVEIKHFVHSAHIMLLWGRVVESPRGEQQWLFLWISWGVTALPISEF